MKHVVAALVLTISVGILLERLPEPTVARVGIPFRVLQLQLREPDNSLLMPVAGVPVEASREYMACSTIRGTQACWPGYLRQARNSCDFRY